MSDNSAGASGPGRPKDLAKRQAILEAAKNLFVRNGYANTSMDAVATEARVSKLTVYNHFTDKETLFSAAVVARCEEQIPELFFNLNGGQSVETVLLSIGRGFNTLANSAESIELHRLMVTLGSQDPKLSKIFFEAGPQRLLTEMERVLVQIQECGALHFPSAKTAAEHFFSLLKGACNFRLMIGLCDELDPATEEQHVQDVVGLFMRAYQA
ncbi:TetR/AcrR family transcriptional regulator [Pseudomonas sp. Pseusp122]|uniref:TetR/AcrR family transcriptional regulator n=1 Tax=unclassified Pseudomonas TaxID=196821 RepID=UPI0039A45E9B